MSTQAPLSSGIGPIRHTRSARRVSPVTLLQSALLRSTLGTVTIASVDTNAPPPPPGPGHHGTAPKPPDIDSSPLHTPVNNFSAPSGTAPISQTAAAIPANPATAMGANHSITFEHVNISTQNSAFTVGTNVTNVENSVSVPVPTSANSFDGQPRSGLPAESKTSAPFQQEQTAPVGANSTPNPSHDVSSSDFHRQRETPVVSPNLPPGGSFRSEGSVSHSSQFSAQVIAPSQQDHPNILSQSNNVQLENDVQVSTPPSAVLSFVSVPSSSVPLNPNSTTNGANACMPDSVTGEPDHVNQASISDADDSSSDSDDCRSVSQNYLSQGRLAILRSLSPKSKKSKSPSFTQSSNSDPQSVTNTSTDDPNRNPLISTLNNRVALSNYFSTIENIHFTNWNTFFEHYEFKLYNPPGDGNCLFHSVWIALSKKWQDFFINGMGLRIFTEAVLRLIKKYSCVTDNILSIDGLPVEFRESPPFSLQSLAISREHPEQSVIPRSQRRTLIPLLSISYCLFLLYHVAYMMFTSVLPRLDFPHSNTPTRNTAHPFPPISPPCFEFEFRLKEIDLSRTPTFLPP